MMKFGRSSCIGIRYFYFSLPWLYSTSSTNKGNPTSCSLSKFLIESLGFSNTLSISICTILAKKRQTAGAKSVPNLDVVDKANSVVHFLTQLGFKQSQIRKIVRNEPRILVSRVDKTLKPKIKLLNDVGISGSDLLQVIVNHPSLFRRRLSPILGAFRTVLGSDVNVVRVLKCWRWINFTGAAYYLIPNVELLQTYCDISTDDIHKCIIRCPDTFSMRTDLFRAILVRVELKLGIPRDSVMFLYGIQLVTHRSDKNIEDKCEIFKSFGWTQSDILEMIKRNPLCLTSGEPRIKERLDFLMNQLGYNPTYLASCPQFLTLSLEKRLLPRHRVLQALKEKGLLRMDYHLVGAIGLLKSEFLKRFVMPFEEVHELYAQLTGSKVGSLIVEKAKSPF